MPSLTNYQGPKPLWSMKFGYGCLLDTENGGIASILKIGHMIRASVLMLIVSSRSLPLPRVWPEAQTDHSTELGDISWCSSWANAEGFLLPAELGNIVPSM